MAPLGELVANSGGEDIRADLAFNWDKLATEGETSLSYITPWGIDGVWR